MSYDANHEDEDLRPSKSQLKREMNALQNLGAELVKLSAKDLAKIPLPDELAEAIDHARNINSHGAQRRQLQFIGKLMRGVDPGPIQEALDIIRQTSARAASQLHQIERWRDRIVEEGQSALNEFSGQYPQADRQQLRQLMMNARKEREKSQPPKSARSLFRCLRDIIETAE